MQLLEGVIIKATGEAVSIRRSGRHGSHRVYGLRRGHIRRELAFCDREFRRTSSAGSVGFMPVYSGRVQENSIGDMAVTCKSLDPSTEDSSIDLSC